MAGYKLTIANETAGEPIILSTENGADSPDIISVHFKMNTLDDLSRNRADAVRSELVIKGNITEANMELTKQIARWAMDKDQKTLYRDISLEVWKDQDFSGERLRTYEINKMFVLDYEERFGEKESDSGKFELFIAQKEGNADKNVFCG